MIPIEELDEQFNSLSYIKQNLQTTTFESYQELAKNWWYT
jgi:hypothetical protein